MRSTLSPSGFNTSLSNSYLSPTRKRQRVPNFKITRIMSSQNFYFPTKKCSKVKIRRTDREMPLDQEWRSKAKERFAASKEVFRVSNRNISKINRTASKSRLKADLAKAVRHTQNTTRHYYDVQCKSWVARNYYDSYSIL